MMYQVGQRIPQFRGPDGLFLSLDDSGFMLVCRMARPTAKEKRAFGSRQLLRISAGSIPGIMFWTVKFGDIPMMDCTYAPQVASFVPSLDPVPDGQGYALTIILADAETGEILNIRVVGLPHDFSVSICEIVEKTKNQPVNYKLAIAALYSMTTQELDEKATVRCSL